MIWIDEQLTDLYKLHIVAKEWQHGIKKTCWKIFEPSRFVYAFFAFNSFYSIDWEESVREGRLVKWATEQEETENQVDKKTDSQKLAK